MAGKKLEKILETETTKVESSEKKSRKTDSSLKNDDTATFAIFAEPAVATKAYDPKIVEGLVVLSRNQQWRKKVGHVCFAGSALPYVPTFYGKQNQRELIFLGYDPDKNMDERYAEILEDPAVPKEVKETIKKWGLNKILTLEEAAEYGRKYFGTLIEKAFPNVPIHYIYGEEDNRNFDDHVELEFDKVFVLKEEEEKHLVAQRKNQQEKGKLEQQQKDLETQQTILGLVRRALDSKNSDVKTEIDTILNNNIECIDAIEYPERFRKTLTSLKKNGEVNYKLEAIDRRIKALKVDETKLNKQEDEIIHQLSKIAMQKRVPSFFRSVKRKNLDAAHAEEMRARVKPWYQALLCHIFQNNPFYPHGGNSVELVLDGVKVALHHQASVRSITPIKSDIRELMHEYAQKNRSGKEVPDVIIIGHGASGMRAIPQAKTSESLSPKKGRETPDITTIIQSSTLQSEEKLGGLVSKTVKNSHTKRYEAGNFASGVLLYTLHKKTKEVELEFVTSSQLLKDYHLNQKLIKLQAEIDHTKTKSGKEKLQKRIETIREKLKFNPVKGLAIADTHFGCANISGRPSNYNVFQATMDYLKNDGLPDVLVVNGDMVHGALDDMFGPSYQYFGDVPSEIGQKVDKIIKNKQLSGEEKLTRVRQLYDSALAAIPIANTSKQMTEFRNRMKNVMENVLEKNGYLYITSGNHYNKTSPDRDEALDIVNVLDSKYKNHPHLYVFSAEGEKSGVGEGELPNGKKIFCCHEPKRGSDQIVGALNQLQSSNLDPFIAVFAHNHHPAAGYGGSSFIVNSAGMQPWTPYVSRVGLTPGLRGCVYFELDKNGREQVKWKFVLDPTLEQIMGTKAKKAKPS